MIHCPKCFAENPQGTRFCSSCSEPLNSPPPIAAEEEPKTQISESVAAPQVGLAIASLVLGIVACVFSIFVAYLQNGRQIDLAAIVLSQDGRSYTLSGKYNDANGQEHEDVEVYEKQ